jgi:hypothetical protein
VRYRTAAILAAVLIGGMFCLPAAVFAVLPAMKQGLPIPVLLGLVGLAEKKNVGRGEC